MKVINNLTSKSFLLKTHSIIAHTYFCNEDNVASCSNFIELLLRRTLHRSYRYSKV